MGCLILQQEQDVADVQLPKQKVGLNVCPVVCSFDSVTQGSQMLLSFCPRSTQWNMRVFFRQSRQTVLISEHAGQRFAVRLIVLIDWLIKWLKARVASRPQEKQRKFTHQGKTEHKRWMVQPCGISVVPSNCHGQKWDLSKENSVLNKSLPFFKGGISKVSLYLLCHMFSFLPELDLAQIYGKNLSIFV